MTNAVVYLEGPTWWAIKVETPSREKISRIEFRQDGNFHVVAGLGSDKDRSSLLLGVDYGPHSTLAEAMEAVASVLAGRCEKFRP